LIEAWLKVEQDWNLKNLISKIQNHTEIS
jgi:hypothetical protein